MKEFLGLKYCTPLDFDSRRRRYAAEAVNLQRQIIELDAQKWILTITMEPDVNGAKRAAAKLSAHRNKMGIGSTFTIPMPQHLGSEPPTQVIGTSGNSAPGAKIAMITTADINPPLLLTGHFFQFDNHAKIYQITDDVQLVTNVAAALSFFPTLLEIVPANTALEFDPNITVRYAPEGQDIYRYTEGILSRATVQFEEDI